jgi:hypothetical protein
MSAHNDYLIARESISFAYSVSLSIRLTTLSSAPRCLYRSDVSFDRAALKSVPFLGFAPPVV